MPAKSTYSYIKGTFTEVLDTGANGHGWMATETAEEYLTRMGFDQTHLYAKNSNFLGNNLGAKATDENQYLQLLVYPARIAGPPPVGNHLYQCCTYVNVRNLDMGTMVLVEDVGHMVFLLNDLGGGINLPLREVLVITP
jgi:hypothetical protein